MKSLMLLWQVAAKELAAWCGTSTTRDYKTVESRVKHEGLSFLTITLPTFGKDFQKSLDQGYVGSDQFESFSRSGGLPQFLGGFLCLVFDRVSGELLEYPSLDAIFSVRQLTLMMQKIELPTTAQRERKAFASYIECEKDLKLREREWSEADYLDFSRVSKLLFGWDSTSLFSKIEKDIDEFGVFPKHGPGKTADRVANNARFNLTTWPARLEKVFSCDYFLVANARHLDLLDRVQILEPGAEIPVRVVSVPKTLKTPRIIAMEPAHMMYVQQSIYESFVEHWGRDDLLHSFLGFDDQSPNQQLALKGSLDGSLATLDLSEASDRVSNQLVLAICKSAPSFMEAVQACRSRRADVSGHGVIRLSKFASMGSALCFPVEACVFLTCIFLGIEKELNSPLTRNVIKTFLGKVRVFGDDIIVPREFVPTVMSSLEHFGAKVNRDKSFWNGKFRESCGKEYYDGTDVSIVRIRQVLPSSRQQSTEVIATSSTRNQFYQLGLWKTCAWLDRYLAQVLGWYPVVSATSAVIGRHSILDSIYGLNGYIWDQTSLRWDGETKVNERKDRRKWNGVPFVYPSSPRYHIPLIKGYVPHATIPIDKLDGHGALLKFFLKRGDNPYEEGHLERAGRSVAVTLKLQWSAY